MSATGRAFLLGVDRSLVGPLLAQHDLEHDCMPEATAALIRTYYDTFNGGDREAFLALLTDDVAHDVNQGDREVGKEAFRAFIQRMDRCYREQVIGLVVMTAPDGMSASAEFIIEGTYLSTDDGLPPASGQTYRLPVGAFFSIREGRIARVTNFYNLNEWLRQIGA
jgi:steroid delta-isomerase-like uncharacterized protein